MNNDLNVVLCRGLAWDVGVKNRRSRSDHSPEWVKERRPSRANPRCMPYVGAKSLARVIGGDAEAND